MSESSIIEPVKDQDEPHPVSTRWRPVLKQIVDALVRGDYELSTIPWVEPLSERAKSMVVSNVDGYGEALAELPEESWSTSIVHWMGSHWEVLVDLWTTSGRSDLVLFVDVEPRDDETVSMSVYSLYVP